MGSSQGVWPSSLLPTCARLQYGRALTKCVLTEADIFKCFEAPSIWPFVLSNSETNYLRLICHIQFIVDFHPLKKT